MVEPATILLVDDDPERRSRAADSFDQGAQPFALETVASVADALEQVASTTVDCVVSPVTVTETDAAELLASVRAHDPAVAFVLFLDGREVATSGAGADEFGGIVRDVLAADGPDGAGPTGVTGRAEHLATQVESLLAEAGDASGDEPPTLDHYRILVESVGDPMFVTDETGRFTLVNDAMAAFAGIEREKLVGSNALELLDEERVAELADRIVAAVEGATDATELNECSDESDAGPGADGVVPLAAVEDDGNQIHLEFSMKAGDGDRIGQAHVTPLVDAEGRFCGTVGSVREVTEQLARERELGQYETIMETVPVGVIVLDENAQVQWLNEPFIDRSTMREEDLLESSFWEFIARGAFDAELIEDYLDIVRHLLSSSNDDEMVIHEVDVTLPKSGEQRFFDVHTALLPLEDGEYSGTVNVFRDVTERTRYARELERQNDRLEEFAGVVSHDLRNPLNVARGHLDVHESRCTGETESLEEVAWSLDRMEELIEDVLALARQGRTVGDPRPVELEAVVTAAWQGVDTAEATLHRSIPDGVSIHADEGRLRELFENCFRNAVEHGGESVTVSVEWFDDERESDIAPSGLVDGKGFVVSDDGPGLPDDDVFDVGFTTAEEGTGLGLAIVAQIAEAHGWTVAADSEADGGARIACTDVTVASEASTTD